MGRYVWYALAGVVVLTGLGASLARSIKSTLEATDFDWEPLEDIWDEDELSELMSTWYETLQEIQTEHFIEEDALIDGDLPDAVAVGFMLHLEMLPAALAGLWKVMTDQSEEQSRQEALVRGYILVSELRVLVQMYETYANLGMVRIEEIDDLLPNIHAMLASVDEAMEEED